MIALIDYDAGNIRSVGNALSRLGAEFELTASPERILAADKVILPGVGNAAEAMASLRERGLCEVIRSLRVPVLGICGIITGLAIGVLAAKICQLTAHK